MSERASGSNTDVVIDPRCKISYYTYVISALTAKGCRVRFRRLDLPPVRGMSMLIGDSRVWMFTGDDADEASAETRAWADVLAEVNVPDDSGGVLALGPLFGIRIWPLPRGYTQALALVAGGGSARRSFQYVRFQGITRVGIDEYVPSASDPAYVYSRARNWRGRHQSVNDARLRFIEAVSGLPIESDVALINERVDLPTYLRNTGRSAVVFNNPAVKGCLGWKLGEFLALGKAIITLPIERALPSPLVHGVHVHEVPDDVEAMRDAVRLLTTDNDYRRHLETGARQWFDDHLAPNVVGTRLLDAVSTPRAGTSDTAAT